MDVARQEIPHGMASGAGDDVAAQLGRLQDELSAIKQTIAGFGKVSSGACSCEACVETARKIAQHAEQEVQAAIADLKTFAQHNPRYVLGGALGVGLVLGLMLHRR